jgi:hypothetical protein
MSGEDRMMWALIRIVIYGLIVILAIAVCITRVLSQEHHHPKADLEIHQKFYNTWMMPDAPQTSCCHDRDCYPTEARKIGDRWEARRREDGQWLVVPPHKIEQNRDNPDGRNHLCAPPPSYGATVYCFMLGNGT